MLAFFFFKKSALFDKNSTLLKVIAWDLLALFTVSRCVWNVVSQLLQISHKSEKWKWRYNLSTWRHRQFFCCCCCCHSCVSLAKVSHWSRIHVNIITSSRVMKFFLYDGLTRNPQTRNFPVWVLPNIWRLGKSATPDLTGMSLMKSYLMLQNGMVIDFNVSDLLRENQ